MRFGVVFLVMWVRGEDLLFSIITICKNNGDALSKTIESVKCQSFTNFEYIIVDGKSDQNTLGIIGKYSSVIDKICTQLGSGIYDALNIGLEMAEGDYVVFVHGGDRFASTNILSSVASQIAIADVDLIFGGKEYLSSDEENIVRRWIPGESNKFKWWLGWMPPHLGCIFKRQVYKRYGGFDSSYSISGDYEFLLRVMYRDNRISMKRISKIIVQMGTGGVSHSSLRNIVRSNCEVLRAWRDNCGFVPYWIFLTKPFSKLIQFYRLSK